GLFLCLFVVTLYLYFNPAYNIGRRNNHTSVMISISAIMFFIATFHLAIDCYRILQGFVDKRLDSSGPIAYLSDPNAWHYILRDILFGTQQTLGSAAA
ncbi:hypothetical protein BDQ17DRAFT_1217628, partial [Cyathus striatus]